MREEIEYVSDTDFFVKKILFPNGEFELKPKSIKRNSEDFKILLKYLSDSNNYLAGRDEKKGNHYHLKTKNEELVKLTFWSNKSIKGFETLNILKEEICTYFKTEYSKKSVEFVLTNDTAKKDIGSRKKLFTEMMISAGPRKTDLDTELGEDVAGFYSTGDKVYFWILDGMSHSEILTLNDRIKIMYFPILLIGKYISKSKAILAIL